MQTVIKLHDSDWNLVDIAEDIEWCRQQNWQLAEYLNAKDHSHCRVCWWAIGVSSDPDVGIAYTAGSDFWLCKECYSKFIANAP